MPLLTELENDLMSGVLQRWRAYGAAECMGGFPNVSNLWLSRTGRTLSIVDMSLDGIRWDLEVVERRAPPLTGPQCRQTSPPDADAFHPLRPGNGRGPRQSGIANGGLGRPLSPAAIPLS